MTDLDNPYKGTPPTQPIWGSLRKPDEPPAPTLEEWVARIRDWSLNDGGTPPVKDWQTPRTPPDHSQPFIRPLGPPERGR